MGDAIGGYFGVTGRLSDGKWFGERGYTDSYEAAEKYYQGTLKEVKFIKIDNKDDKRPRVNPTSI